jgi:hypothetical protein
MLGARMGHSEPRTVRVVGWDPLRLFEAVAMDKTQAFLAKSESTVFDYTLMAQRIYVRFKLPF